MKRVAVAALVMCMPTAPAKAQNASLPKDSIGSIVGPREQFFDGMTKNINKLVELNDIAGAAKGTPGAIMEAIVGHGVEEITGKIGDNIPRYDQASEVLETLNQDPALANQAQMDLQSKYDPAFAKGNIERHYSSCAPAACARHTGLVCNKIGNGFECAASSTGREGRWDYTIVVNCDQQGGFSIGKMVPFRASGREQTQFPYTVERVGSSIVYTYKGDRFCALCAPCPDECVKYPWVPQCNMKKN